MRVIGGCIRNQKTFIAVRVVKVVCNNKYAPRRTGYSKTLDAVDASVTVLPVHCTVGNTRYCQEFFQVKNSSRLLYLSLT